jgi:hypothetical protein
MNYSSKTGKWIVATLLAGATGFVSCKKPFEGVKAILSNNFVQHTVAVQIVDAKATNPYPAGAVVTLSGEAVNNGLIYTSSGDKLTTAPGSAAVVSNTVGLAIKPYTVIAQNQPIRFTINVEAPGYLPATKEVVVGWKDSLQYIDMALIKLSSVPAGVTVKQAQVNGVTAGTLPTAASVTVSNTSNPEIAKVNIPAGTGFKDAAGQNIAASGALTVVATHFDSNNPASIDAVPGGLTNVMAADGKEKSFVLGAALDLTAKLGTTEVKSFSQPLQADVTLSGETYNPNTNNMVKAGDVIEVWSSDAGSTVWKKEGTATIFLSNGQLKATMNITHLSKWMVAFSKDVCSTPVQVSFETDAEGSAVHYVAVYAHGGAGQFLAGKKVAVANGDVFDFSLPSGIDVDLKLYEGADDQTTLVQTVPVAACAPSVRLHYPKPASRPELFFDLETHCTNGTFRYSGPIDYRSSNSNHWAPFTPADNGKLTTSLLDWDKTYYFRIIYNGVQYVRSRTVLKTEFRQDGTTDRWIYWGKDPNVQQTFFAAPTACN